jgi:hypothetical protein
MEWEGYCWHQFSINTCSPLVILLVLRSTCRRERRPLTTQPSAVAPGGEGQGSESMPAVPQRGAGWVLPSWWSYV